MAWSTPWAPTEQELAGCVECGLCLPHCPTFRLTGDEIASPRGRLNAMVAVGTGLVEADDAFDEIMSFCLQCRACEAACPSLVPFGRAMEGARAELAAANGGRLRRRLVGKWIGSRRLMGLASVGAALAQRTLRRVVPARLRPGLRGLRRIGWRRESIVGHSSAGEGETVGLLAGCVMDPWFPSVNHATVAVLEAAGHRVVVPPAQTCCGALAAHDGAAREAEKLAEQNAAAFADCDRIVANAAGCSAHLAGYSHWGFESVASRATDALHLVADAIESGVLPTLPASGAVVGIQDPCHHRHAQGIISEPRAILGAAGYEVIEIDPAAMCCGAAGLYSVTQPDASRRLGEAKAAEIDRAGVDIVASANPGCEIQLRSHTGGDVRIAHPIELYAEAVGISPRPR